MSDATVSTLHYHLIHGLIERGACPGNAELARSLKLPEDKIEHLLRGLSDIHGVVLHPHVCEPWIAHPFSLTPTLHCIQGRSQSWWAPCVWCAFGVAVLVGGEAVIHTRYGAEAEVVSIPVVDGEPVGFDDVRVHFAIPPARAWDNVHLHCSLVLPFHSEAGIAEWCGRHKLPQGQAVPLKQVAALARNWYGTHADPGWHKWSVEEAQAIFHRSGFVSDFWNLKASAGTY